MWLVGFTGVNGKSDEVKVTGSPATTHCRTLPCTQSPGGPEDPACLAIWGLTAGLLDIVEPGFQKWQETNGACQLSYHWEHVKKEGVVTTTHQISLSHSSQPKDRRTPWVTRGQCLPLYGCQGPMPLVARVWQRLCGQQRRKEAA